MKTLSELFPAKPVPSAGARALASIFDNLVNGNLTDAKKTAKRYPCLQLACYSRDCLGWSQTKALAAACYLKGSGTFQAYCDAS